VGGLTHGTVGIIGIPAPGAIGPVTFDNPRSLYYLVFFFLVLGVFVMRASPALAAGPHLHGHPQRRGAGRGAGHPADAQQAAGLHAVGVLRRARRWLYAGFVRFLGPGLAAWSTPST
jgi:branched-chain amino acid transport system permease protein